jgi:hypothetical protein
MKNMMVFTVDTLGGNGGHGRAAAIFPRNKRLETTGINEIMLTG